MSAPTAEHARQAAALARRTRAEWLMGVAAEAISVDDVLAEAGRPTGRPLAAIGLRQLLASQAGWGMGRADRVVARVLSMSGATNPSGRRLTLGWLLDPRCGGVRYLAWCDALHTDRASPPWTGFPYTPGPRATAHSTFAQLKKDTAR